MNVISDPLQNKDFETQLPKLMEFCNYYEPQLPKLMEFFNHNKRTVYKELGFMEPI